MASFVAIYAGASISEAQMIAVSSDPALVSYVAGELLSDPRYADVSETDPVLAELNKGRRRALRMIRREWEEEEEETESP